MFVFGVQLPQQQGKAHLTLYLVEFDLYKQVISHKIHKIQQQHQQQQPRPSRGTLTLVHDKSVLDTPA